MGGWHLLPEEAFWVPDVHSGPYTPMYIHVQGHCREKVQDERGQDANSPEAWILDTFQKTSETIVWLKSSMHTGEWRSMGWRS